MKNDTSRTTVLIISMGFLVLYIVFDWNWAIYISLVVGISGAISIFLANKIEWIWMKLAKILGYIVPNILLSAIFFLFLFPISLMSKLVTKDPLKVSNKYKSHFSDIERSIDKASFEKTW